MNLRSSYKMKTSEQLREAKALITNPDNWTRLELARDANDEPVWVTNPSAVRFCATGARLRTSLIANCWNFAGSDGEYLRRAARKRFHTAPSAVNDLLGHEAVMVMYDYAIELAEQDERTNGN